MGLLEWYRSSCLTTRVCRPFSRADRKKPAKCQTSIKRFIAWRSFHRLQQSSYPCSKVRPLYKACRLPIADSPPHLACPDMVGWVLDCTALCLGGLSTSKASRSPFSRAAQQAIASRSGMKGQLLMKHWATCSGFSTCRSTAHQTGVAVLTAPHVA